MAKALIAAAYGSQGPDRSYIGGCSTAASTLVGGRPGSTISIWSQRPPPAANGWRSCGRAGWKSTDRPMRRCRTLRCPTRKSPTWAPRSPRPARQGGRTRHRGALRRTGRRARTASSSLTRGLPGCLRRRARPACLQHRAHRPMPDPTRRSRQLLARVYAGAVRRGSPSTPASPGTRRSPAPTGRSGSSSTRRCWTRPRATSSCRRRARWTRSTLDIDGRTKAIQAVDRPSANRRRQPSRCPARDDPVNLALLAHRGAHDRLPRQRRRHLLGQRHGGADAANGPRPGRPRG